jgi:hypothetical protein
MKPRRVFTLVIITAVVSGGVLFGENFAGFMALSPRHLLGASVTPAAVNAPAQNPHPTHIAEGPLPLPPEIKAAVNKALRPEGAAYPVVHTQEGAYIDTSKRAISVTTAVLDEQGKLLITDYSQPVK